MTRTREPGVDDDATLVAAARSGEHDAFATLVDRYLDRCWAVAVRIVHDRELAADVAQEAVLTAWQQLDRLQEPAAFGGWVLRIARNRALDRLERERRAVPTADHEALEPDLRLAADRTPELAHERAAHRDLVWAAAAALGERDASLLDLHLRHGLGPSELAEELGLTPNAAHQAMFKLRARLGDAIRAFVLWRDGTPSCVALDAELVANGSAGFDRDTARAIDRHAETCASCERTRTRATEPAAMFAAVPLLVLPAAARAEVVRALGAAGVPVHPPAAAGAGSAPATPTGDVAASGGALDRASGGALRGLPRRSGVLLVAVATLLWLAGTPTDDAMVGPTGAPLVSAVGVDGEADDGDGAPSGRSPDEVGDTPDATSSDPAPSRPAPDGPGSSGEGSGRQVTADARTPQVADPEPEEPTGTDEDPAADEPAGAEPRPEEPAELPVIDAFVVRSTGQACRVDRTVGERALVTWATSGADEVVLRAGSSLEPLAASGEAEPVCLPTGTTPVLEASNTAGTVTATG